MVTFKCYPSSECNIYFTVFWGGGVADLKIFSWCNVIEEVKRVSPSNPTEKGVTFGFELHKLEKNNYIFRSQNTNRKWPKCHPCLPQYKMVAKGNDKQWCKKIRYTYFQLITHEL